MMRFICSDRGRRGGAGAFRRLALICFMILPLWAGAACSLLPPKTSMPHVKGDGARDMDQYAQLCYDRGLRYMDEFRYELARQQFAFAASAAASPDLYQDSVDALRRAERLIIEGR